jgi:hypothetical protein
MGFLSMSTPQRHRMRSDLGEGRWTPHEFRHREFCLGAAD